MSERTPLTEEQEHQYTKLLSERMQDIVRDPRWSEQELTELLIPLIEAAQGEPVSEAINEHLFHTAVQAEFFKQKVRSEATRRLASENYTGSEELSWEALRAAHQSFIIEDLVPENGVVFFVAKPNLGKTFGYIDMVCCSAFGLPWLGKQTRQVKVTIVLGEGHTGFIDRVDAWCDAHGKSVSDLEPWVTFVRGANLNNDESIARIREVADRHETELLIFDTWATSSGAQSEDDAGLNSETLRRADTIRPGATRLFVHHPRKSDEDTPHPVMRGSSSLAGNADVVMTMFRDSKFRPKSGEVAEWLSLSTEGEHGGKNRHAQNETIRGLYLEEHGDSAVFRQLQSESISKESRKVSATLKGAMSINEFVVASGLTERTARRYLKMAVADSIAIYTPGIRANVPGHWTLTDPTPPEVNWDHALQVAT